MINASSLTLNLLMLKLGQPANNAAAKRSQLPSTAAVTGRACVVGGTHRDMLEKDDSCKLLLCLFCTLLMK